MAQSIFNQKEKGVNKTNVPPKPRQSEGISEKEGGFGAGKTGEAWEKEQDVDEESSRSI